jgi:hypothetical protein
MGSLPARKFEKLWENDYFVIYRRRSGQTTIAAPGLAQSGRA